MRTPIRLAPGFAGLAAIIALFALVAAPAQATEKHVFDPTLSLEGNCNGKDGVLDPSCPYLSVEAGGPRPFLNACATAVDRYGDLYALNVSQSPGSQGETWIDIFDPEGRYLTRIDVPAEGFHCTIAVDSTGILYTSLEAAGSAPSRIVRYTPGVFPPVEGTAYAGPTTVVESTVGVAAVDPSDDHLYLTQGFGSTVEEFDSAANGNGFLREAIDPGVATNIGDVAVCGSNHDVYISGTPHRTLGGPDTYEEARVFAFSGSDGHKTLEIDGSEAGEISSDKTPENGFGYKFGNAGVALDQANCDLYVDDVNAHGVVDQFTAAGTFIGQLPATTPTLKNSSPYSDIAVDDPVVAGEPGYQSPNPGNVYVAGGQLINQSHLFAFRPRVTGPPAVRAQAVDSVTDTEATLTAELNPNGLDTTYSFQYLSEAAYLANGESFTGPETPSTVPVPAASAGAGGAFKPVFASIAGLSPGTAYRFRLVAENCADPEAEAGECLTEGEGEPGGEGEDASFATYPTPAASSDCPNAAIREAQGATLLPECRAYELVTPPDTNGRIPTMAEFGGTTYGVATATEPTSPDGETLAFGTLGGALPGIGGGGFKDAFFAHRGSTGWQTSFAGLSSGQSSEPAIGAFDAAGDSLWEAKGRGSLVEVPGGNGVGPHYIRRPAGVINPACSPEPASGFEFVGCGSRAVDPWIKVDQISPDGSHIIMGTVTAVGKEALEPCAPDETLAVYDRTADGVVHCVSVKPDGSSFAAHENAEYEGASLDGTAVAFKVGEPPSGFQDPDQRPLYVRLDDARTVEVPGADTVFGGLSENGERLVYQEHDPSARWLEVGGSRMPQGEIFVMDTSTEAVTPIGAGQKAVLVNVSADGSHVYFVSPEVLTGSDPNNQGAVAEAGQENLYLLDGSSARFVATVTASDVAGEPPLPSTEIRADGLGLWTVDAVSAFQTSSGGPGADPSRASNDGQVFVFESRANLTSYDSGGHRELYRYDASDGDLTCISCNPSGAPAASDAQLQSSVGEAFVPIPPVNAATVMYNLADEGDRVFFQSADRLALNDVDGKLDVYEWQAKGTGGCEREAGCLRLISGGHSGAPDYLYAIAPGGHDVFFESGDLLAAPDVDPTPSIYDARVDGGFPMPPTPPGECLGESCQPSTVAPDDATPATSGPPKPGNPKSARHRRRKHRHRAHARRKVHRHHTRGVAR